MSMMTRTVSRREKAIRKRVAKNLRRYIDECPLTIRKLSKKANVSTTQLYNVLHQTNSTSTDILTGLAHALNVEVGDFFVEPHEG